LGQTKDYKICICCVSAKHAAILQIHVHAVMILQ
jgi:hypothetical protein